MRRGRLMLVVILGLGVLLSLWWMLGEGSVRASSPRHQPVSKTYCTSSADACRSTERASDAMSRNSVLFMTVDLSPNRDNTLYEHSRGLLSNGVGQHFFAGKNDLGLIRRGTIAFTVAGEIPPGSIIVSATLRLNMSKTESGAQPVTLHRLTESWGEGTSDAPDEEDEGADAAVGDATWLYRFFNVITWTAPGGDFTPTASATTTVAGLGSYAWRSPGMVADVQAWLDDPDSNHGWLLRGNESTNNTTKRFDTKEHPTEDNRPLLSVAYLLPPELTAAKSVNNPTPLLGERITYTIFVSNTGQGDATEGLISDTLPVGLSLAGPVSLDPPAAGIIGTPPILVRDLTIAPDQRITLTVPTSVGPGVAIGTQITNTASVTSAEVITPVYGAVAVAVPQPLQVDKMASNPSPIRGETITYTITVANLALIDLTDVWISDTMPVGINFVGPVVLDPPGPGTLQLPSKPPTLAMGLTITTGQRITLTFPVSVSRDLAIGSQITNTVAVTSAEIATPVMGSVAVAVISAFNVHKAVSNADPIGGETITYTITVANNTLSDLSDVVVSDTMPAGINFVGPVTRYPPPLGTLALPGLPPILAGGLTIPAGQSITLTFPVSVSKGLAIGTQITNTVAVTSAEVISPSTATAVVTIANPIRVDKKVSNPDPIGGETITYTIAITNSASADITNVTVSDTMPTGINFVGPVTRYPPPSGTLALPGLPPILAGGLTIPAGQSITLTFPVSVSVGLAFDTQITNTVAVTSAEVISPSTATAVVTIANPIRVDKKVSNPDPIGGETITYTIAITNSAFADITNVTVSDTMPAGINFVGPVSLDPFGPGALGTPPILAKGLVVPSGDSIKLTFPVSVSIGLAIGARITNTVAVTSAQVFTPSIDRAAITIANPIRVDKQVSHQSPMGGQIITYTIAVTNSASADITNVLVSDTMPAGINFVGPVTRYPPGPGNLGTPPILASGLMLANGDSITLTFPVSVGRGLAIGTRITNTVAVTSAEVITPSTKSVPITVSNPIEASKAVDNLTPNEDEGFNYTIVISNTGLASITDVLISDTMPAGVNFVGPVTMNPSGPGTLGVPPILARGMVVPSQRSVTLTVPVALEPGIAVGTRITNTAAVTSAEVPTPVTVKVAITVDTSIKYLYLPVIFRDP